MRYRIALAALVVFFASALVASAAPTSLHVIASSHSSGSYAVTAANGSASSHAIYLRAYGSSLSAYTVVACSHGFSVGSSSQNFKLRSGVLKQLKLPNGGGDCDVTASLSGSGSIRLQILAG